MIWDVFPRVDLGISPTCGRRDSLAVRPASGGARVIDDPGRAGRSRRTVGGGVVTLPVAAARRLVRADEPVRSTPAACSGDTVCDPDERAAQDREPVSCRPSGNLQNSRFREIAGVRHELIRSRGSRERAWRSSRGTRAVAEPASPLDYEPRSVQDVLGRLDRPRAARRPAVGDPSSTFTGQVDRVRVEVARRNVIHWDGNPVSTFEVVQTMGPWSMRTWVRIDGVILRQEVPFSFVRLLLDRRSEEPGVLPSSTAAGGRAP
jgi:hypothetical protein